MTTGAAGVLATARRRTSTTSPAASSTAPSAPATVPGAFREEPPAENPEPDAEKYPAPRYGTVLTVGLAGVIFSAAASAAAALISPYPVSASHDEGCDAVDSSASVTCHGARPGTLDRISAATPETTAAAGEVPSTSSVVPSWPTAGTSVPGAATST